MPAKAEESKKIIAKIIATIFTNLEFISIVFLSLFYDKALYLLTAL